jgi:D-alanine-D-alanine ligase-like ATP-grasp enzyme
VREPWRAHPLAWLHRAEASGVARELGLPLVTYRPGLQGPLLLRFSDPVMLDVTAKLTRTGTPYVGPSAAVMQTSYDKLAATRLVAAAGIACPATAPADEAAGMELPLIAKPRRGSDSLGVRIVRRAPMPRFSGEYIAQEFVRGRELTVAVMRGMAGMPLQLDLPEGTPYTFARKYLFRVAKSIIVDEAARETALHIARLLAVNWAARIDFMRSSRNGRLYFLECDVAPMIGADSAFAQSLAAAGVARGDQLRLLVA